MKKALARKSGVFLLLVALIFVFAAGAEAERQGFGNFEIYVPYGWTVERSNVQATFMAPENVAALSIIVDTATGTTAEEVARDLSGTHGGTTPEAVEEGTFMFSFQNEGGVHSTAIVVRMDDADLYMIWVIAGEHPQLGDLIESFQWIDE